MNFARTEGRFRASAPRRRGGDTTVRERPALPRSLSIRSGAAHSVAIQVATRSATDRACRLRCGRLDFGTAKPWSPPSMNSKSTGVFSAPNTGSTSSRVPNVSRVPWTSRMGIQSPAGARRALWRAGPADAADSPAARGRRRCCQASSSGSRRPPATRSGRPSTCRRRPRVPRGSRCRTTASSTASPGRSSTGARSGVRRLLLRVKKVEGDDVHASSGQSAGRVDHPAMPLVGAGAVREHEQRRRVVPAEAKCRAAVDRVRGLNTVNSAGSVAMSAPRYQSDQLQVKAPGIGGRLLPMRLPRLISLIEPQSRTFERHTTPSSSDRVRPAAWPPTR